MNKLTGSCPFCGSGDQTPAILDKGRFLAVKCEACEAFGPIVKVEGPSKDEMVAAMDKAVGAWNRRHTPT